MRLTRNAARCLLCDTVVESKHRHDFVRCKCGNLFVDGGHDYLRRGIEDTRGTYEELSERMEDSMSEDTTTPETETEATEVETELTPAEREARKLAREGEREGEKNRRAVEKETREAEKRDAAAAREQEKALRKAQEKLEEIDAEPEPDSPLKSAERNRDRALAAQEVADSTTVAGTDNASALDAMRTDLDRSADADPEFAEKKLGRGSKD